ncbi:type IX secretion system sortase PorU [Flavobacterium sp.]|uniref:type IX secretion system sortase PorU n=1 Tax=Flavobacterium sp. TaxID=239 RepID=UPI0028BEF1DF|nr:type IX secretion system sortase PorU [Flavobacterium sp.]
MKKYLLFLVLLTSFLSFSQQSETVTLEWKEGAIFRVDSIPYRIPVFQAENFDFNSADGVIQFKKRFPVSNWIDEASLVVENIVYESIAIDQFNDVSKTKLTSNINAKIATSSARDILSGFFTFNPIIKEGSQYKRVKSLSFRYSYKTISGISAAKNANSVYNSVLATGNWYKFHLTKSGVYKVTKGFLQQLGMNTNVDPKRLKIYGNGGRMVPLSNAVPYPMDLEENAIQVIGEEDNVFNDNDYILFYAEGVDVWNDESSTSANLYDDKSYYYVTVEGGNGKRIPLASQPSNAPNVIFTAFDDYQYYEIDKYNLGKLGRKWVGDEFRIDNVQTFNFDFPNLVTSVPIEFNINAVSASFGVSSFEVKANGQSIGNIPFATLNPTAHIAADENVLIGTFSSSSPNVAIQFDYDNGGVPSSNGYLDYISLIASRSLQGYGKQFLFKNRQAATNIGTAEYQLSNASGISQVWDVTDLYNATKYENAGQNNFSFKAALGEVRNYVAVDMSNLFLPSTDGNARVANQNLKGTLFENAQGDFQDIDYLIVTPSFLKNQAEKLANFHRNYSQLSVRVVELPQIYREFSSGKQDIGAIRNLVKYIYENASVPSKRIKYVNLFGDGSYDYKNRISNNTNIVPLFHAFYKLTSQHPANGAYSLNYSNHLAYMSDDFYGLMDLNEGFVNSNEQLDVAVGRMLVSSVSQADAMVNKVIQYHDEQSYGRWRNNCLFVSDDIDKPTDQTLQTDLDNLANEIAAEKPFINIKKIHTDAYLQVTSAGGNRYPKAKEDMLNEIGQGSLVVNYFGHGGEDGLAQERMFEKLDAQNLSNQHRYPLFITITCEFTRFDNPQRPTGGEYMYWNTAGGAVSLVATTREISQSTGKVLNDNLAEHLFSYGSNNYVSIAEALVQAKNQTAAGDIRVAFYIGDPALKLAIPKPKVRLTKINDVPITQPTDTLKALSYVKLSGEVVDEFDNLLTNYNGDLAVQIFDKQMNRSTLGNDGTTTTGGQLIIMNFITLGETIFRGNASVNSGLFEFGFVVPRDIRIPVGNGRISFYAKNNSPLEDQTGYDTTIKVGDINTNAVADNLPPRIRLYMNDETFVSGGITNESPFLLAYLEDENGINTASGIGHDIVAILDGDETNPYILNDYYETEPNDYTRGKLRFPFRNLAVGLHTLTLKCWDVYNNFATAEIQFIVVGDGEVTLSNVLNYPNPFVSYTEFWFSHNKPYEPLDVQVQILTITGKLVKTINQSVVTEGFLSREIKWDGKDDFGDRIGKGVYVYRLTVRSSVTGKKAEKIEKLVIL